MLKRNPQGQLAVDGISVRELVSKFGTPVYVYSETKILQNLKRYQIGLAGTDHKLCYAVKCNNNRNLLKLLKQNGACFDIASLGELKRVLDIGVTPENIIFTGPGKPYKELEEAVKIGIFTIHAESVQEIENIEAISKKASKISTVSVRINPNICDSNSHKYVATGHGDSKFGMPIDQAKSALKMISESPHLHLGGIHYHVGSQILSLKPILKTRDCIIKFIDDLRDTNIKINFVDIGGGIGIPYNSAANATPQIEEWLPQIIQPFVQRNLRVLVEPGRSIVGEASILICEVQYTKSTSMSKKYVVVDASMTDMIRPCLYDAHHDILLESFAPPSDDTEEVVCDVVGPVCECADFLGVNRLFPSTIAPGDIICVTCVGAYGYTMASNYNARCRPPEVLIKTDKSLQIIRRRETYEDTLNLEVF